MDVSVSRIGVGELELARAQADGHPELVESLDAVLDELERLERLAHNLLVLARSRSGSLTAGDTPVDLETVVDRAVRDVSRRAGNHHVAIRRHGNAAWIHEIGMDRIIERPGHPGSTRQWTPFALDFDEETRGKD